MEQELLTLRRLVKPMYLAACSRILDIEIRGKASVSVALRKPIRHLHRVLDRKIYPSYDQDKRLEGKQILLVFKQANTGNTPQRK